MSSIPTPFLPPCGEATAPQSAAPQGSIGGSFGADAYPRPSHVLVVSDAPEQLQATMDFLRAQLFRVTLASGWRGYHYAQAWHPDIIVIDGGMSSMDPLMLGRLLMQAPDTRGTPLVFLFERHNQAASREAFALGAVDCMVKPVYPEEVLARISTHLRSGARRRIEPMSPRTRTVASEDLLLRNALNAIALDVGSIHTVRQLARSVGTNERKLSALFKSKMGKSAHKVILGKKMETARRLLAQTGMPVRDIGVHVGFPSVCNFSVAFRRENGITPTAYRRQFRAMTQPMGNSATATLRTPPTNYGHETEGARA